MMTAGTTCCPSTGFVAEIGEGEFYFPKDNVYVKTSLQQFLSIEIQDKYSKNTRIRQGHPSEL